MAEGGWWQSQLSGVAAAKQKLSLSHFGAASKAIWHLLGSSRRVSGCSVCEDTGTDQRDRLLVAGI